VSNFGFSKMVTFRPQLLAACRPPAVFFCARGAPRASRASRDGLRPCRLLV